MNERLHFVVEGQSEESFVNRVLGPHLSQFQVWADARCVYTSRQGAYWLRGGVTTYARIKGDVVRWMKQDRNADARFTTMLDLYKLPADFPGWDESKRAASCFERAGLLERAFAADLAEPRFIPYVQVHEFEALILVDPKKLAVMYPGEPHQAAIAELVKLRSEVPPVFWTGR